MVISNCEITKQNSEILRPCVMDTQSSAYKSTKQFHTGVDLTGHQIFSAYSGTVVLTGRDELGQCVIVQTGSSFCISYRHLSNTCIQMGADVTEGQLLGQADRYVHVELLQRVESDWPVRISTETWYKRDPEPILNKTLRETDIALFDDMGIVELSDYPSGTCTVDDGQIKFILSNN